MPNFNLSNPDAVSIQRLQVLHPAIVQEATSVYNEIMARHLPVRITDGFRSFAEQDDLYAIGRTKPGKKVTNAKGGQSYHNYGLAIDFCLIIDNTAVWEIDTDANANHINDWSEVVSIFKQFGWEWGGDWQSFKDYPHLQKTFGFTVSQLLQKHNSGLVDPKGYVVLH